MDVEFEKLKSEKWEQVKVTILDKISNGDSIHMFRELFNVSDLKWLSSIK